MKKTGRKSVVEELQIKQRYAALSEPYFKVLQARLKSQVKREQDWAVEQLTKAYTKMIPQEVGGIGGEPIEVTWLSKSPTIHVGGPNVSTTA